MQSILGYDPKNSDDRNDEHNNEALPKLKEAFESAMNDDFNTAQAIASLFDHTKKINKNINAGHPPSDVYKLQNWLKTALIDVLGLKYTVDSNSDSTFNNNLSEELLHLLLDIRTKARMKRDFELSDIIRDRLKKLDIELKDSKEGTRYSLPK